MRLVTGLVAPGPGTLPRHQASGKPAGKRGVPPDTAREAVTAYKRSGSNVGGGRNRGCPQTLGIPQHPSRLPPAPDQAVGLNVHRPSARVVCRRRGPPGLRYLKYAIFAPSRKTGERLRTNFAYKRAPCDESSSSRTNRKPKFVGGVPIAQPPARASRMKSEM